MSAGARVAFDPFVPGATEVATGRDAVLPGPTRAPSRTAAPLPARRLGALLDAAEREMFLVLVVCFSAVLLLVRMASTLSNDSWLTLVAGREIVENGLPRTDTLTVWAGGVEWVDQQWLAQLWTYGVFSLGGIQLALLFNVALVAAGLAVALAAARAAGASERNVAAVGAVCLFAALPNTGLRAQTLAYPLFAGLLWLLARDARRPSRHVFLFVPLLVLWANIHGSAVIGAALVALAGLTLAATQLARFKRLSRPTAVRAATMALTPWPLLLASPYGLSLVDYYQGTLGNPQFASVVSEWRASAYPDELPFFVLLFGVLWLVARYGGRLTVFERLAVVAAAAGGVVAVRNIVWFVLATAVVAPQALERLWPARERQPRNRRLNLALVAAAVATTAMFVGVAAMRPSSSYEARYPPAAADAVARAAARDPEVAIYANEGYANWLLWREPQLRGRVAYDVRFELLTAERLTALFEFRNRIGDDWRRAADGFGIVVLDVGSEHLVERELLADEGTRRIYRDARVSVLVRPEQETR
jgi:hypothetical protein